MAEPIISFRNFLRSRLTDYNNTRTGVGAGDEGKNWIYDDLPRPDLTKFQYPRIGMELIHANGELLGASSTDVFENILVSVEIWTHADLELYISGTKYKRFEVVDKIATDIRSALRTNWQTDSDFSPIKFGGFVIRQDARIPYDESRKRYGRVMELELLVFNPAE